MGEPSDYYAKTLARAVLGMDDFNNPKPHPGTVAPELARAQMTIDLRLESMVRGICQQIWVDSAAVAANVEAKVREALNQTNIEREIDKAIEREMGNLRRWLAEKASKRLNELVDRAIDERIGDAPKLLAKKITDRMWAAYTGRKPGKSDIYGRGYVDSRGHTRKKR